MYNAARAGVGILNPTEPELRCAHEAAHEEFAVESGMTLMKAGEKLCQLGKIAAMNDAGEQSKSTAEDEDRSGTQKFRRAKP